MYVVQVEHHPPVTFVGSVTTFVTVICWLPKSGGGVACGLCLWLVRLRRVSRIRESTRVHASPRESTRVHASPRSSSPSAVRAGPRPVRVFRESEIPAGTLQSAPRGLPGRLTAIGTNVEGDNDSNNSSLDST